MNILLQIQCMSGQCLCLGHICSGRCAINESTIFRTIFQASQVATAYAFTFCIGVGRFRILGGPRFRILGGGGGGKGGQISSRHMTS